MKLKNILFIFTLLIVICVGLGAVSATDINNDLIDVNDVNDVNDTNNLDINNTDFTINDSNLNDSIGDEILQDYMCDNYSMGLVSPSNYSYNFVLVNSIKIK